MPDGSTIGPLDFPPAPSIRPNPDYVPMYVNAPAAWQYDIDQANGVSRATYIGEVFVGGQAAGNRIATQADIAAATTGVSTFNGRSGTVVLSTADVTGAGGAPLASPAMTGTPTVPLAAPGTNTGQAASTAFVSAAITQLTNNTVMSVNGRSGAVTLGLADIPGAAPSASPALTGNPTAPTAATTDSSTSIATTAFVKNAIGNGAVTAFNGRIGNVSLQLTDVTSVGGAPISGPAFTNVPTAPTAAPGTATTQLATCAFVTNAITGATTGVSSFNTRTGAVTLQAADVSGVGGALLAGPAFTGVPTAPTAGTGNQSGQLATTQFVANALQAAGGVSTWNGRSGAVTMTLADVTGVGGAPNASPAFSGTPTAPTVSPATTSSTALATCAFVQSAIAAYPPPVVATTVPLMDGTATIGASGKWADGAHVHPTDTTRAPINSPTFTGNPVLPMATTVGAQPSGTNNSTLANTAWVSAYFLGLTGSGGQTVPGWTTFSSGIYVVQGSGFSMYVSGGQQTLDFGNGYAFYKTSSQDQLGIVVPNGAIWNMRNSDGFAFNNLGNVGGQGAYANLSDRRSKRDIRDMTEGLDVVLKMTPKRFRRVAGHEKEHEEIGFIAQDMAEVLPEAVWQSRFDIPGVSEAEAEAHPTLGLTETALIPVLVNAMKELAAKMETPTLPPAVVAQMEAVLAGALRPMVERIEALEARANRAAEAARRHPQQTPPPRPPGRP